MNAIDLSSLYRDSIGFDRLASILTRAQRADGFQPAYPAYNIESLEDNRYAIHLVVAGYTQDELDIQVENGVLTVSGKKSENSDQKYLYQGIGNQPFERKFNLADYVEVVDATISNGILKINLVKEIPEAMKPKKIKINQSGNVLDHKPSTLNLESDASTARSTKKTPSKSEEAAA